MEPTFSHMETPHEYGVRREIDGRVADALSRGKRTRDTYHHMPDEGPASLECPLLGELRCMAYPVMPDFDVINANVPEDIYTALEKQLETIPLASSAER